MKEHLARIEGAKVILAPKPCFKRDLEVQMQAAGYPYRAEPRSDYEALQRACREYSRLHFQAPNRTHSVTGLRNTSQNGLQVGWFDRRDVGADYNKAFRAKVSEGKVYCQRSDIDCDKLQNSFDYYKSLLPAARVRAAMTHVLEIIDGQKIITDLWWLPDEKSVDKWSQVKVGFGAIGSSVYTIQCDIGDPETARLVIDTIRGRVEKMADRVTNEIRENRLGEEALYKRRLEAADMKRQLERYETVLGESLQDIRETIEKADMEAATAMSIRDHGEVFADVFGED